MQTIFEALRADHDVQRQLLRKISETSGDSDVRRSQWAVLKDELETHEQFEERNFYKVLLDYDSTQEKSRHSISEHKDIDDLIEKIDETEFSSSAWLTHFKQLKELVEHHLDEEEKEVFTVAGKVLDREQKHILARRYNLGVAKEHSAAV